MAGGVLRNIAFTCHGPRHIDDDASPPTPRHRLALQRTTTKRACAHETTKREGGWVQAAGARLRGGVVRAPVRQLAHSGTMVRVATARAWTWTHESA